MPAFYNFRQNELDYSFDDIFVPADFFREGNLWVWGSNHTYQLGVYTLQTPPPAKSTPVTTSAGGSNWKQVRSGSVYTVAIKTDGTLWTWGSGTYGQLGNNQTTTRSTPVTTFAGGNDWKQVSGGRHFVTAIKTDGTLWTWGIGSSGRLGNSQTTNRSTPVTTFAGGNNWKQVSSGFAHTAAIKTDGTLWTWGNANQGKLGNAVTTGSISTPVTTFAGGNDWKQVSSGGYHTATIKTDGTLWIWGSQSSSALGNGATIGNISTPITTFAGGNNWKEAFAGRNETAAIKTDGTLWVWGTGNYGKLGVNDTITRSTPITTFAGGTNWKQVDYSDTHTAAIKTDGTLWIWGYPTNGKLGNGADSSIIISTPITTFAGGTNWKQVSGGSFHTAAVTYIDPVL